MKILIYTYIIAQHFERLKPQAGTYCISLPVVTIFALIPAMKNFLLVCNMIFQTKNNYICTHSCNEKFPARVQYDFPNKKQTGKLQLIKMALSEKLFARCIGRLHTIL